MPIRGKNVVSEELHVSVDIDSTVLIAAMPPAKKRTEIEEMLREEDSSSSSEGSLVQSPKFGQRQYSQRGNILKRPVDLHDSMGDIIDELDNK